MSKSRSVKTPQHLIDYMNFHEGLASALPSFTNFVTHADAPFRGLTIFLGDNADVVIGVKRFAEDGSPEIAWTSGADVLSALQAMEKTLRAGKWKVDKRAASR